jgi:hypothetical protein
MVAHMKTVCARHSPTGTMCEGTPEAIFKSVRRLLRRGEHPPRSDELHLFYT